MKFTDKIHQLRIDSEIIVSPGIKIPGFINILTVFGEGRTPLYAGLSVSGGKIFSSNTPEP
jgi:hypothetical protein